MIQYRHYYGVVFNKPNGETFSVLVSAVSPTIAIHKAIRKVAFYGGEKKAKAKIDSVNKLIRPRARR